MTKDVNDLLSGYEKINSGLEPSDDSETTACIYHDLANYEIESGLSKEEFIGLAIKMTSRSGTSNPVEKIL